MPVADSGATDEPIDISDQAHQPVEEAGGNSQPDQAENPSLVPLEELFETWEPSALRSVLIERTRFRVEKRRIKFRGDPYGAINHRRIILLHPLAQGIRQLARCCKFPI